MWKTRKTFLKPLGDIYIIIFFGVVDKFFVNRHISSLCEIKSKKFTECNILQVNKFFEIKIKKYDFL